MLSDDHKHVDPDGAECALITASCVDYSSAGAQDGLNGTRGWQVVDAPRTLLHFRDLLVSLVENAWGGSTPMKASRLRSTLQLCGVCGILPSLLSASTHGT